MKFCRYVCAGTNQGTIHLLDPGDLTVVMAWQAHSTAINWMDAQNNHLVTCGWSTRPNGARMLDPFAQVYDLNKKKQLPPLSFPGGAAYVQMHPRMSTTGVVASQAGQIQLVDIHNANTSHLHQVGILYPNLLMGLVMAPSGEAWCMIDKDNAVHLWGSANGLRFLINRQEIEFATPSAPIPSIPWEGDHPFSLVGMPHYREKLFSAWPDDEVYEVGFLPPKFDNDLLKTMTETHIGLRGQNPRTRHRNQIQRNRLMDSDGTGLSAPKFLSEKSRGKESDPNNGRRISDAELLANAALAGSTKAEVPIMYRNVEIKYSKFGVDDFDFKYYNKTKYSGLETHITNSYLNPLLQLLKYIPLVRNLALHHAGGSCLSERCLLCELGYLFDMVEKAAGQSCQATNFLKAFSNIPEARRWNVSEDTATHLQNTLDIRIQVANRFLMDRIGLDAKWISEAELMKINRYLLVQKATKMICMNCQHETFRQESSRFLDLHYKPWRFHQAAPTFSDVLMASFHKDSERKGFCNRCKKYAPISCRPEIRSTPPVLILNTRLENNPEARHLWATPDWLPTEIAVVPHGGSVVCLQGEAVQNFQRTRTDHGNLIYELVGLVADINSGEKQKSHLVSVINVAVSEPEPVDEDRWHLFNDFLVRHIPRSEALRLSPGWKMPAVLAYQLRSARHFVDDSWQDALDTRCLYTEYSMNHTDQTSNGRVLKENQESPQAGTHVAIDSEFVALQQEEIEIKADGDREVIRPTRLGLARVSALRGSGINEGVPFINDYIKTYEPVVDYLTKYSGLREGDLDPTTSSHALLPLKVAYKKLWLLLNLGCIFVGHGLPSDFRTINIHVPESQVLDTVTLFHLRSQKRKLSLRFLTWYFLKEDIQQDTHDSIEDARMALKLWKKYQEFKDAGIVAHMLEEVYREGRRHGFKPPSEQSGRERLGDGRTTEISNGRETPDIIRDAASGPGTPAGRRLGRDSEYFESPLR